jgi:hypothetical protein
MQTLGTWLQMIGTGTIGFGVVFAWLKVSGRVRRARVAAGGLVVQLRSAISRRNVPHVDGKLTGGSSLTVTPMTKAEGVVIGTGTPELRLSRVEDNFSKLKPQLDNLGPELRSEWHDDIDNAIASALEEFSELSDAARWWDIMPTVFGVVISIAGYVCQLCA